MNRSLEILSLEVLVIGTQTHTSGVRVLVKSTTLMDRLPMLLYDASCQILKYDNIFIACP